MVQYKTIKKINAIANLTNLEYLDTSVYNMEYEVISGKNKTLSFNLPTIFVTAKAKGENIKSYPDKSVTIVSTDYESGIVNLKANLNDKVTFIIRTGVYKDILCNVNITVS